MALHSYNLGFYKWFCRFFNYEFRHGSFFLWKKGRNQLSRKIDLKPNKQSDSLEQFRKILEQNDLAKQIYSVTGVTLITTWQLKV